LKKLVPLLALAAAAVAALLYMFRPGPPQVGFARAVRETLVSNLVTNGRAEPIEWVAVRAEREGAVEKVLVEKGRRVAEGDPLVELDSRDARADLASAEARIAQARSDLEVIARGGRRSDLVAVENSLARARMEMENARRDLASLSRLEEKQAAAGEEVRAARDRVRGAEMEIDSLTKKRAALVSPADREAAEARLREAEAAAAKARRRIELGVIRSPMQGVVYNLEARRGAYIQPGDLVAETGRLERVRVIIYVDEPELGRVAAGIPVTITWDALPGKEWQGTVERVPTQIVALGTRQVGEVSAIIENPGLDLPAGANINATIRSGVAENALAIPKEALRREANQTGVFVLEQDKVLWRPVKTGISSVTRVQILEGLSEGAAVALPAAVALSDGATVSPVFP